VRDRRQTEPVGIHESRPANSTLVAPERDVRTGRSLHLDRSDKGRDQSAVRRHAPTHGRRLPTWAMAAGAVGLLALIAGGVVFAAQNLSDDRSTSPTSDPTPIPSSTVTNVPAVTVAATTVVATTTSSTSIATTSTVPAALDPVRINGYDVTATVTRLLGLPPPDIAVGDVSQFTITCTAGQCGLGQGRVFQAAAPSFDFTRTFNVNEPPSPCDPVTETIRGVRSPDGSYVGEFISDPTVLSGQDQNPDGSPRSCDYNAITQVLHMTPSAP
jgi:hypothetical protein